MTSERTKVKAKQLACYLLRNKGTLNKIPQLQ